MPFNIINAKLPKITQGIQPRRNVKHKMINLKRKGTDYQILSITNCSFYFIKFPKVVKIPFPRQINSISPVFKGLMEY